MRFKYENHAPIISILGNGNVKVTDYNNEEKLIEISESVEMSNNKITILQRHHSFYFLFGYILQL